MNLLESEKRKHCLSVRLSPDELSMLDRLRRSGGMRRGTYARLAIFANFANLPRPIPTLNQEAWVSLSRASSNLNQLAKAMNSSPTDTAEIAKVREALAEFRDQLIFSNISKEDKNENHENQ